MIQGSDGLFYRVTKFEESSPLHVFVDAAEYPLGEYERLSTNLDNTEFLGTEGPGWFKFNADDAESYGAKYCLMLDGYGSPNKGVGFFPSTIEDLNNDWDTIENETLEFTRVTENYKMRSYAKHGGIIPVTEEEYNALLEAYPIVEAEDLSEYINDELKVFDIADTYPDYPSEWTLPSTVSLDNDTYNYLGISGELVMGDGYGEDSDWVAVQFDMAANSTGDNIIRDIDGNAIIGYCYSSGSDGLWVGHGERSFGGTVYDSYGVKRLSNYLKTEVGGGSSSDATGRGLYSQHDICTIIMDNEYGTVDSYTGNYYTVKTYINSILISTKYYSGSFNGIGSIESTGKQYFGLLTIYASANSRSENTGSSEDYLLFAINFDGGSTKAQVGTAECTDITLDEGSDGTTAAVLNGTSSYISATQDDGTPLLRGTDTATISMRAKLEQPSTTNGWYFYTAWNNNAQSGGSRSYIGMYSDGTDGSLVAERYRDNSGTPTIIADTGFDTWYDITYIIDGYLAEVYVDGEFVGSVDYESSGSDHIMSTILGSGDNIVTYFGRANWGSGEYAKGMFDDIAVYSFAPAIDLGDLTSVKSDIELPTAAESSDGYTIEWESSDETTVANDGTVTRPTDGDKIVTLTATITFGDKTLTREFEATVKEISNGVYIKSLEPDGSAISYELEAGDAFDSEKYDVYIAVYNEEGALNAVVKNQMSGTIETNSSANERIKVMVWEKDTMNPVVDAIETSVIETSVYKLMSYTTDGGEYYGSWSSATAPIIGNSLHLAVSSDGGETYTPLNYNTGVLYAEADYSAEGGNPYKGVGKMLRDPYVFRTATGYGVIAARADETSDTDSADGSVMIYTSEDLTDFEFAGYLTLDTAAVYEPACVYENGKYTISWSTSDGGTRKYEVTEDFKSIGGEGASDEVYENPSIDIDHSVEATNVIGITAAEYKTLTANLNAPINTGVEEFEDVTVSAGANAVLPETATALYNDGSTQEFPVTWDTSSLDTSVAGEYTLTGTVTAKDYDTSLIANRADPCALYANGKYYFTATRDNGSQYVLNLRVADTIEGLAYAEDILLYDAGSELIWAPEIHEVDGTMMIFFAYGATWDKVRSHVIVLEGDDAENADDWSEPQRIMLADGETNLIDNGITLDMTCFEWDGTYYLAWAQRQVSSSGDYNYSTYGYESSNIYIAKYNPANPAQLASDPVVISRPSYGWERTIAEVDEGPFVIENDGRLYMTVAANSTNCSYAIKLLTLNEGGDPTNPDDWSIKGYPLLSTAMNDSEPGPGHSSFTIDENGDPVLVYHWGSRGSNRTTTVKNVHFNTNGEPVLNIPRGEQLSDEFKTVTIKVTIE